ncbi:hypothetical protein [Pseudoalteromonas sp. TB64]|uniref:hypothetical protein n=1 Tax=Pseudoalteromonas sp. TB64 TaxID=1938600 RepID=UPI0004632B84|nr:hypothetical protein [Pseudoalteromonas sp. TB64]
MKENRYIISKHDQLVLLFDESQPSYESFEGDYTRSRYGTYQNFFDMPEYQLDYSPFIELALECGMSSFSLKRSSKTGRIYAWNTNIGAHGPKLELRPVKLQHVMNMPLMKKYHENWAYELGCNIDIDATYEI